MLSFRTGTFFGKNQSGFGHMAALVLAIPFLWRGIPAVPLVTLIRAPAPPPQLPH